MPFLAEYHREKAPCLSREKAPQYILFVGYSRARMPVKHARAFFQHVVLSDVNLGSILGVGETSTFFLSVIVSCCLSITMTDIQQ
jgi:hypothetical protein